MLRLVHLGLRRQGIAVHAPARSRGAHVPLAEKRALLDRLLQVHGASVLLRIGEGIADARDEPALVALSVAREPHDLIDRWQRLERYVHSRHRVVIDGSAEHSLVLRHLSLDAGHPPVAAEDLLVLGLLVALIDRIGALGLQAQVVGDRGWRRQAGSWAELTLPQDVSRWALTWQLGARASATRLEDADDWVTTAHRVLAADAGRRWTLQTPAREMDSSPRSLQRRLSTGGGSFSALLCSVRLAQSARLLVQTRRQPAEIGYVCGFADQAHFTREFKRYSALTPGKYRQEFAILPVPRQRDLEARGVALPERPELRRVEIGHRGDELLHRRPAVYFHRDFPDEMHRQQRAGAVFSLAGFHRVVHQHPEDGRIAFEGGADLHGVRHLSLRSRRG